jgi:hypothetical protein
MSPRSFQNILLGLLLALSPSFARAATEGELRAAVIYNIARFVQWPPAPTGSTHFDICTVGNNAVSDALTALAGKPLNGQPAAIRPVRRDNDLSACRVLYIVPDETVRMAAISEILTNNHEATLTISDAPSFLALGGMVQLVVVEERQRFRINQELAEKANLNINAKLMQLSLPVRD